MSCSREVGIHAVLVCEWRGNEEPRHHVKGVEVAIASRHEQDYISLTAFKPLEFDTVRNRAGLNSFALSPKKWIEAAMRFDSKESFST